MIHIYLMKIFEDLQYDTIFNQDLQRSAIQYILFLIKILKLCSMIYIYLIKIFKDLQYNFICNQDL